MDRYLGVDIGRKTLGVAISDPLKIIAQPLQVLNYELNNQKNLIELIQKLIKKHNITKIIYGLPKNMDGSESLTTKYVLECIDLAKKIIKVPFIAIDERWSSIAASKILVKGNFQKHKRKKLNDQIAASLILQTYLDGIKNE